jgi:hypothetical protein
MAEQPGCLYLNIWGPANSLCDRIPVFVPISFPAVESALSPALAEGDNQPVLPHSLLENHQISCFLI